MNPKICDIEELKRRLAQWRVKSDRIVFTNGCFDILHVGHLHTLKESIQLGDKLIVGLNSDASVSRLKGKERPIVNQLDRSEMLAALEMVDAVIIFEDDTPEELIQMIKPDVLCKGGDWSIENIVGGDFVKSYGGQVVSIPFIQGYSSSSLINKIKSL
ncbi:D-glycero-beta-D-manno-heptose 1-phosphate adenylyltransferase [Chitinophagales bacterium]|nr:D-glycero-beta-D-manno-heptose 1-phosphate adenylyltransferase [Chitinophagales bacterium]